MIASLIAEDSQACRADDGLRKSGTVEPTSLTTTALRQWDALDDALQLSLNTPARVRGRNVREVRSAAWRLDGFARVVGNALVDHAGGSRGRSFNTELAWKAPKPYIRIVPQPK